MQKDYAVVVGIDWADKKHAYALKVKGSDKIRCGYFIQKASSIGDWVEMLRKLSGGGKVAIATEQAKGGLIFALMKYDFIHLYILNPQNVANYRESFTSSGAKSDPADALLILDFLENRYKKLPAWVPEPEDVRLLQRLTEQRVRLVHDLKRLGNKLTSTLKEYFPEVLEMFPRIYRTIVADFLIAYPTLEDAKRATDEELLSFFRAHNAGNPKMSAKRISLIREAAPLIHDRAVIESNLLFVKSLAHGLKALNTAIAEYDSKIEEIYSRLPDKKLFDSLPSAGEVSAPRLLAAMGTDRSRFKSAVELSCFLGISPVIESSGNQSWTHWRFNCNNIIRQSFVEWTFLSLRTCFWAEELYKKLRAKGKAHSVAIRAIAFKWVRIIFRMWKEKDPYSEARYLKALRKAGSPLINGLQPNPE